MPECRLCPRGCGVDRERQAGFCGETESIRIGKIMLHKFEEPVISCKNGSGAVFFSGCNLKCRYCQNRAISQGGGGRVYSYEQLKDAVAELIGSGADNLNLVTAAHYLPVVKRLLTDLKPNVPVIYNSSGYEKAESLKELEGLVDVYLPDFKYMSEKLSERYSNAPDYPEIAKLAISEMLRQQPEVVIEGGRILRGVIIRHLVLPSCRADSMAVIRYISEHFSNAYLSLMSQYTPQFNDGVAPELNRKITTFEYSSVAEYAANLQLKGFMQERGSADARYTPEF